MGAIIKKTSCVEECNYVIFTSQLVLNNELTIETVHGKTHKSKHMPVPVRVR
jgi:hypothetical protein